MHKRELRGDSCTVELREGMTISVEPMPQWTPLYAFTMAWSSSVLLDGKPVHLSGLMPGVGLWIATRVEGHPGLPGFIAAAWPHALAQIQAWQQLPGSKPRSPLILPYSVAWIGDTDLTPPASLHIRWLTVPRRR